MGCSDRDECPTIISKSISDLELLEGGFSNFIVVSLFRYILTGEINSLLRPNLLINASA